MVEDKKKNTFITNVGAPAVMNEIAVLGHLNSSMIYCRKFYCSLHESFIARRENVFLYILNTLSIVVDFHKNHFLICDFRIRSNHKLKWVLLCLP